MITVKKSEALHKKRILMEDFEEFHIRNFINLIFYYIKPY